MRLIDADKLIEAFKDYPFGDSITPQNAIDIIDGFADARDYIAEHLSDKYWDVGVLRR